MRWIYRILVAVAFAVAALVALVFFLPTDQIGRLASDQLERQTGRKLTLSGDFRPTLFPVLGARTGPLTISNADWAKEPIMVSAEGISVGVNFRALLAGEIEVETLHLLSPNIHLEQGVDGQQNWVLAASAQQAQTSTQTTGTKEFSLTKGVIENGTITYFDHATEQNHKLENLQATARLPKGEPSAAVTAQGNWQGQGFSVDTTVQDWKMLANGAASNVAFSGTALGTDLSFTGSLAAPEKGPAAEGQFSLNSRTPAKAAAAFNANLPKQFRDLSNIKLAGPIILGPTEFTINSTVDGTLSGANISGSIALVGKENWIASQAFGIKTILASKGLGTLTYDGDVAAKTSRASGALDVKAQDLRGLLKLFGITADFPKGTLKTASVSGQLRTEKNGSYTISKGVFGFDTNRLTGTATLGLGGKPRVSADLRSKGLDLTGFTSDSGGNNGAGSSGTPTPGWSKERIRISGLDVIDADVALRSDSVNLGVTKLGLTDVRTNLQGGVLQLRMVDVRAFQGAMAGTINVSGSKNIRMQSNIKAKGVQLEKVLGELVGVTRLLGRGDTEFSLTGRGASLHEIMNSLSGNGDLKFSDGKFRGIDLAAMMRNLKSAFGGFEGATEFSSLTGSFTMTDGVLTNVDMSLLSPLFKAAGKGTVDVGGQALNYVITPTRLSDDAEFSVPVVITGPWQNLKFRPDLEKLLDLLLNKKLLEQEELKKAKDKLDEARKRAENAEAELKAKAKKELAKKLKLQQQQDQNGTAKSFEEQAKDKLEDEVKKGLGKLFKLGD